MLLSPEDELAMGKETDPEIVASYGQYEDADLAAYLGGLGKRLDAVNHQPNIPYTLKVLESPVVNAFAVPGGYVYLTPGILAYLKDEAELAGVISHEVGHITGRHRAQQYSRAQAAQLGLGIGSILSSTVASLSSLTEAGISMLFLSFSRENERQADDLGVLYSSKAGFDARQMANLFVTLERLDPSGGSDGLPAWFSTNPTRPTVSRPSPRQPKSGRRRIPARRSRRTATSTCGSSTASCTERTRAVGTSRGWCSTTPSSGFSSQSNRAGWSITQRRRCRSSPRSRTR